MNSTYDFRIIRISFCGKFLEFAFDKHLQPTNFILSEIYDYNYFMKISIQNFIKLVMKMKFDCEFIGNRSRLSENPLKGIL